MCAHCVRCSAGIIGRCHAEEHRHCLVESSSLKKGTDVLALEACVLGLVPAIMCGLPDLLGAGWDVQPASVVCGWALGEVLQCC